MSIFSRFEKLIGKTNLDNINTKTIMIIGIGGVGGYVAESLARSNIKKLILVDYDIIDETNINRQIIALHSTIGMKKVDIMKQRILDINPSCIVETYDTFINEENINIIKDSNPDFVVDACDSINTKKAIIELCLTNNIEFITSMATGNKLDPSKLEITDIRKTNYDPIARILRKWVKDNRINRKITVLYSPEKPIKVNDRTPGSTSFVPSSAGLLITSYIINKIIAK